MDWILDVILKKVKDKLDDGSIEAIKESFYKEDENEMTYAIERIIDNVEARGEARKALEIALEMIKYGDTIEKASLVTRIPADELRRHARASGDRHPAP
jgi:6-phosphogluconate dehydrogenase